MEEKKESSTKIEVFVKNHKECKSTLKPIEIELNTNKNCVQNLIHSSIFIL